MGTMKEHLAGFHKHAAEHHGTLHECYKTLSTFGKSAKSEMKPDKDGNDLCDTLEEIAECHKAAAAYHANAMEECSKSMDPEFSKAASPEFEKRLSAIENRIEPTRISAVAPNRPGITAVPRAGQPAFSEKPNVPIQFSKLVEIEE